MPSVVLLLGGQGGEWGGGGVTRGSERGETIGGGGGREGKDRGEIL